MDTFIFGKTFEMAKNYLENECRHLKPEHIKQSVFNRSRAELYLENGDFYKALPATDIARGYFFDRAIIVGNVSQEFIDQVVIPSLVYPIQYVR